jgi:hypothetical protein
MNSFSIRGHGARGYKDIFMHHEDSLKHHDYLLVTAIGKLHCESTRISNIRRNNVTKEEAQKLGEARDDIAVIDNAI